MKSPRSLCVAIMMFVWIFGNCLPCRAEVKAIWRYEQTDPDNSIRPAGYEYPMSYKKQKDGYARRSANLRESYAGGDASELLLVEGVAGKIIAVATDGGQI